MLHIKYKYYINRINENDYILYAEIGGGRKREERIEGERGKTESRDERGKRKM